MLGKVTANPRCHPERSEWVPDPGILRKLRTTQNNARPIRARLAICEAKTVAKAQGERPTARAGHLMKGREHRDLARRNYATGEAGGSSATVASGTSAGGC